MSGTIFGYTFKNKALLDEALTTPSFRMTTPGAADNQRLEFLGDAVLGFLSADELYSSMPNALEGELTVKRTQMVSTAALCDAAARYNLEPLLKRNRGAKPLEKNAKVFADAIEAIIGAAWLDGGLDAAREIYTNLSLHSEGERKNPKGDLQIIAQAMTPPKHPAYELLSLAGKAHAPVFTVKVSVDGLGEATASAHSRKEAEVLAATELLANYKK